MSKHPINALLALIIPVLTAAAAAHGGSKAFHLESPYSFGAYQHKVQLHAHTNDSDGDHPGAWVMQAYEALGYAAVAKTDHDHSRWTPNLDDPGGHHIIHIPSVEYSGDDELRSFAHMLGINVKTIHHADGAGNRQAQIDQAAREGGATFVCHPYDITIHRRGWSGEQLTRDVKGFTGIEILNGGTYHDTRPGERNYPYKVDLVLTQGLRTHVIATDDFHRNAEQTMDRGYVVINSDNDAKALSIDEIVATLHKGNYFAAGRTRTSFPVPPAFKNICVDGHTITVTTDREVDIQFITDRHNYYRGEPWCSQANHGVTKASYTATAADKWIRIKAIFTDAAGNPSYAFSNPIYVRPGEAPAAKPAKAAPRK
jgi:hypothetical protein